MAIVERTRDNFRFRERVAGSGRETLITGDVRLKDAAGKELWKLNISNKDKTSGSVGSSDERQWRDSRINHVLSSLRGRKLPKYIDADGNRVERNIQFPLPGWRRQHIQLLLPRGGEGGRRPDEGGP